MLSACSRLLGQTDTILIRGKVFFDKNNNCSYQIGEMGISKFIVQDKISGRISVTDIDGNYSLKIYNDSADLVLMTKNNLLDITCPSFSSIKLITLTGVKLDSSNLNIPVICNKYCHLYNVDIHATKFSRCDTSNEIKVVYTNISCDTATNANLRIDIDTSFVESIIYPFTFTNDITKLYFNLGIIPPFSTKEISFKIKIKCNAFIGTSNCIKAYISPSTDCSFGNYNGAALSISTTCKSDTVFALVRNNSGFDMDNLGIVKGYEEEIIQLFDTIKLKQGQEKTYPFKLKTNETFTLLVDQNANHPYQPTVIVQDEKCMLSAGIKTNSAISKFSRFDERLEYDEECGIVNGKLNPFVKSVYPEGFTANKFVGMQQYLEYQLDFYNAYADTIRRVVIIDSLDPSLDISSFEVKSYSHPYQLEWEGNYVFKLIFDPIELIDSAHSLEKSRGFFKFGIAPLKNITPKKSIQNKAEIRMDLKAPVWSNTVANIMFDTLMISLQKSSILYVAQEEIVLHVYPNPSSDFVYIKFDEVLPNQNLVIVNDLGVEVYEQRNMQERLISIPTQELKAGIYFIQISTNNKIYKTARLLVR